MGLAGELGRVDRPQTACDKSAHKRPTAAGGMKPRAVAIGGGMTPRAAKPAAAKPAAPKSNADFKAMFFQKGKNLEEGK